MQNWSLTKDGELEFRQDVHMPKEGLEARKATIERLHHEGRAKSIGVSNFDIERLEEMKTYAKIWPPHVNQILVCSDRYPLVAR